MSTGRRRVTGSSRFVGRLPVAAVGAILLLYVTPALSFFIFPTKVSVPGGGAYDVPTTWAPVGIPGPSDDVLIVSAVTANNPGSMNTPQTIQSLQIITGGGLTLFGNIGLTVTTDFICNGTVTIDMGNGLMTMWVGGGNTYIACGLTFRGQLQLTSPTASYTGSLQGISASGAFDTRLETAWTLPAQPGLTTFLGTSWIRFESLAGVNYFGGNFNMSGGGTIKVGAAVHFIAPASFAGMAANSEVDFGGDAYIADINGPPSWAVVTGPAPNSVLEFSISAGNSLLWPAPISISGTIQVYGVSGSMLIFSSVTPIGNPSVNITTASVFLSGLSLFGTINLMDPLAHVSFGAPAVIAGGSLSILANVNNSNPTINFGVGLTINASYSLTLGSTAGSVKVVSGSILPSAGGAVVLAYADIAVPNLLNSFVGNIYGPSVGCTTRITTPNGIPNLRQWFGTIVRSIPPASALGCAPLSPSPFATGCAQTPYGSAELSMYASMGNGASFAPAVGPTIDGVLTLDTGAFATITGSVVVSPMTTAVGGLTLSAAMDLSGQLTMDPGAAFYVDNARLEFGNAVTFERLNIGGTLTFLEAAATPGYELHLTSIVVSSMSTIGAEWNTVYGPPTGSQSSIPADPWLFFGGVRSNGTITVLHGSAGLGNVLRIGNGFFGPAAALTYGGGDVQFSLPGTVIYGLNCATFDATHPWNIDFGGGNAGTPNVVVAAGGTVSISTLIGAIRVMGLLDNRGTTTFGFGTTVNATIVDGAGWATSSTLGFDGCTVVTPATFTAYAFQGPSGSRTTTFSGLTLNVSAVSAIPMTHWAGTIVMSHGAYVVLNNQISHSETAHLTCLDTATIGGTIDLTNGGLVVASSARVHSVSTAYGLVIRASQATSLVGPPTMMGSWIPDSVIEVRDGINVNIGTSFVSSAPNGGVALHGCTLFCPQTYTVNAVYGPDPGQSVVFQVTTGNQTLPPLLNWAGNITVSSQSAISYNQLNFNATLAINTPEATLSAVGTAGTSGQINLLGGLLVGNNAAAPWGGTLFILGGGQLAGTWVAPSWQSTIKLLAGVSVQSTSGFSGPGTLNIQDVSLNGPMTMTVASVVGPDVGVAASLNTPSGMQPMPSWTFAGTLSVLGAVDIAVLSMASSCDLRLNSLFFRVGDGSVLNGQVTNAWSDVASAFLMGTSSGVSVPNGNYFQMTGATSAYLAVYGTATVANGGTIALGLNVNVTAAYSGAGAIVLQSCWIKSGAAFSSTLSVSGPAVGYTTYVDTDFSLTSVGWSGTLIVIGNHRLGLSMSTQSTTAVMGTLNGGTIEGSIRIGAGQSIDTTGSGGMVGSGALLTFIGNGGATGYVNGQWGSYGTGGLFFGQNLVINTGSAIIPSTTGGNCTFDGCEIVFPITLSNSAYFGPAVNHTTVFALTAVGSYSLSTLYAVGGFIYLSSPGVPFGASFIIGTIAMYGQFSGINIASNITVSIGTGNVQGVVLGPTGTSAYISLSTVTISGNTVMTAVNGNLTVAGAMVVSSGSLCKLTYGVINVAAWTGPGTMLITGCAIASGILNPAVLLGPVAGDTTDFLLWYGPLALWGTPITSWSGGIRVRYNALTFNGTAASSSSVITLYCVNGGTVAGYIDVNGGQLSGTNAFQVPMVAANAGPLWIWSSHSGGRFTGTIDTSLGPLVLGTQLTVLTGSNLGNYPGTSGSYVKLNGCSLGDAVLVTAIHIRGPDAPLLTSILMNTYPGTVTWPSLTHWEGTITLNGLATQSLAIGDAEFTPYSVAPFVSNGPSFHIFNSTTLCGLWQSNVGTGFVNLHFGVSSTSNSLNIYGLFVLNGTVNINSGGLTLAGGVVVGSGMNISSTAPGAGVQVLYVNSGRVTVMAGARIGPSSNGLSGITISGPNAATELVLNTSLTSVIQLPVMTGWLGAITLNGPGTVFFGGSTASASTTILNINQGPTLAQSPGIAGLLILTAGNSLIVPQGYVRVGAGGQANPVLDIAAPYGVDSKFLADTIDVGPNALALIGAYQPVIQLTTGFVGTTGHINLFNCVVLNSHVFDALPVTFAFGGPILGGTATLSANNTLLGLISQWKGMIQLIGPGVFWMNATVPNSVTSASLNYTAPGVTVAGSVGIGSNSSLHVQGLNVTSGQSMSFSATGSGGGALDFGIYSVFVSGLHTTLNIGGYNTLPVAGGRLLGLDALGTINLYGATIPTNTFLNQFPGFVGGPIAGAVTSIPTSTIFAIEYAWAGTTIITGSGGSIAFPSALVRANPAGASLLFSNPSNPPSIYGLIEFISPTVPTQLNIQTTPTSAPWSITAGQMLHIRSTVASPSHSVFVDQIVVAPGNVLKIGGTGPYAAPVSFNASNIIGTGSDLWLASANIVASAATVNAYMSQATNTIHGPDSGGVTTIPGGLVAYQWMDWSGTLFLGDGFATSLIYYANVTGPAATLSSVSGAALTFVISLTLPDLSHASLTVSTIVFTGMTITVGSTCQLTITNGATLENSATILGLGTTVLDDGFITGGAFVNTSLIYGPSSTGVMTLNLASAEFPLTSIVPWNGTMIVSVGRLTVLAMVDPAAPTATRTSANGSVVLISGGGFALMSGVFGGSIIHSDASQATADLGWRTGTYFANTPGTGSLYLTATIASNAANLILSVHSGVAFLNGTSFSGFCPIDIVQPTSFATGVAMSSNTDFTVLSNMTFGAWTGSAGRLRIHPLNFVTFTTGGNLHLAQVVMIGQCGIIASGPAGDGSLPGPATRVNLIASQAVFFNVTAYDLLQPTLIDGDINLMAAPGALGLVLGVSTVLATPTTSTVIMSHGAQLTTNVGLTPTYPNNLGNGALTTLRFTTFNRVNGSERVTFLGTTGVDFSHAAVPGNILFETCVADPSVPSRPPTMTVNSPTACGYAGCVSSPCVHGACTNGATSYTCACTPGYSGVQCQTDINECQSQPCANGGVCVDAVNSFACACAAGYAGSFCQTDINECASQPCVNGACVDAVNAFSCSCLPGYSGQDCRTDVNECASSPCVTPGAVSCSDAVNGFVCHCAYGYTGVTCQSQIDYCSSAPCQNGGQCQPSLGTFVCHCPSGYNGLFCEQPPSGCAVVTCLNGGQCVSSTNPVTCACHGDFAGPRCEYQYPRFRDVEPRNLPFIGLVLVNVTIEAFGLGDCVFTLGGVAKVPGVDVIVSVGGGGAAPDGTGAVLSILSFVYNSTASTQTHPSMSVTRTIVGGALSTSAAPFQVQSPVVASNDLVLTDDGSGFWYHPPSLTVEDCTRMRGWYHLRTQTCDSCPVGAVCPGGEIIFPIEGYWSPNEYTQPTACAFTSACPGAIGQNPNYPPTYNADGSRVTDLCDSQSGYTGDFCSQCLPAFYADGLTCQSCGADSSYKTELALKLLAAVGLFAAMALAVAFLTEQWLAIAISILMGVQQFVIVGRAAVQTVAGSTGIQLFNDLAIFNFDVEFVKPGCSIGQITYASVYAATVIIILIAALMFVGASLIWVGCRREGGIAAQLLPPSKGAPERRGSNATPEVNITRGDSAQFWARVRTKANYSLIVLAYIVYLQYSTRAVQGLVCVDVEGVSRLEIELSTICYTGDHLIAAIFIWISLFVYCLGLPVYMARSLYKAYVAGQIGTEAIRDRYGYLVRGLQDRFYWIRLLNYVVNFALAVQIAVTPSDNTLQVFTCAVFFTANFFIVGYYLPFKTMYGTVTYLAPFGITQAQAMVLLSVMVDNSTSSKISKTAFFYILLGLSLASASSLAAVHLCRRYRCIDRSKDPTMLYAPSVANGDSAAAAAPGDDTKRLVGSKRSSSGGSGAPLPKEDVEMGKTGGRPADGGPPSGWVESHGSAARDSRVGAAGPTTSTPAVGADTATIATTTSAMSPTANGQARDSVHHARSSTHGSGIEVQVTLSSFANTLAPTPTVKGSASTPSAAAQGTPPLAGRVSRARFFPDKKPSSATIDENAPPPIALPPPSAVPVAVPAAPVALEPTPSPAPAPPIPIAEAAPAPAHVPVPLQPVAVQDVTVVSPDTSPRAHAPAASTAAPDAGSAVPAPAAATASVPTTAPTATIPALTVSRVGKLPPIGGNALNAPLTAIDGSTNIAAAGVRPAVSARLGTVELSDGGVLSRHKDIPL